MNKDALRGHRGELRRLQRRVEVLVEKFRTDRDQLGTDATTIDTATELAGEAESLAFAVQGMLHDNPAKAPALAADPFSSTFLGADKRTRPNASRRKSTRRSGR